MRIDSAPDSSNYATPISDAWGLASGHRNAPAIDYTVCLGASDRGYNTIATAASERKLCQKAGQLRSKMAF